MAEPQNAAEYIERFAQNQKIDGYGVGNIHIHMPCPFCAAPDFLVYELLDTESALEKGGSCQECKRAAHAEIVRQKGGVQFEMVQTAGPDQPEWLVPKMRRISG